MTKKNVTKKLKEAPEAPELKPAGTYLRESGMLYLNDKFDKDTIHPLILQITEYNMMPKELAPKEITLHINSPGGTVFWAWQLIDAIKM